MVQVEHRNMLPRETAKHSSLEFLTRSWINTAGNNKNTDSPTLVK